jgi:hypothetical protein
LKINEQRSPKARAHTGSRVLDLTAMQIRAALAPRLRGQGRIDVRRRNNASLTISHCLVTDGSGPAVSLPVAQLRVDTRGIHLYRRRGNGRWVPYATSETAFVGTLHQCLAEIRIDHGGCFWN